MATFGFLSLALLSALFAAWAYRCFVSDQSNAKDSPIATLTEVAAGENASLQAHRESEFPEGWWTGERLFELERRAIFSKQWIYLTHRSHFNKPGDYHTFQLVNFPVFLILGKDHIIRAFHNVCRHRAYTITKKKSGSSTVLGCRYHGWSYDTRGQLVKAPAFEDIENFDKSQNGLFEIHLHTTRQGFVFVNLCTEKVPSPDVKGVDVLAKSWGISERSVPLVQLEFEESINWKQAVHYMERYGYAVSVVPTVWLNLTSKMPFLSGMASQGEHSILDSHGLSSLHIASGGRLWYILSISPTSASQTAFTCYVYLNWPGDTTHADVGIRAIKEGVESILLSAKAIQPALDGMGGLQGTILSELTTHLKGERKAGKELWPARRESTVSEKYNQADLLCKQLNYLKPKTNTDVGVLEKLGSRNELEW